MRRTNVARMTDKPTSVARLTCDEPTARRLSSTLGEIFGAGDTACAGFEDAGTEDLAER